MTGPEAVATVAVTVVMIVLVGFALVGYRIARRNEVRYEVKFADCVAHRVTMLDVRKAVIGTGIRYEVKFADWGPDFGDMRWRYTIWDADLAVKRALGATGIDLLPVYLGNAPTREQAERAALDWVYAHDGHECWVVSN